MKRQAIHLILIVFIAMAIPFHATANNYVDFNFPKDVSQNALNDLNKALKSGNGQQTVDALVRYSIAQSSISQDNMPEIVSRIDAVIAKEKQPHIRALLYHLEALAFESYRDRYAGWRDRNNPAEELPADFSEWDRKQFNHKIIELIDLSLTDVEALKATPVTSLPGIIKYNELGATYVPTLLEFMYQHSLDLLIGDDDAVALQRIIKDQWTSATQDNAPAHIYALVQTGQNINLEVYRKYQDSEYCAKLLDRLSLYDDKEMYKLLNEYVTRHPNSMFVPEVKNMITGLENKTISVRYPKVLSSHDSVKVEANVTNVNSFNINVYRVPDHWKDVYNYNINGLDLVSSHPMTVQGEIPFSARELTASLPPLPYGAYIIVGIDPVAGNTMERAINLYNYDILNVTDMALIDIAHNNHNDRVAAVNVKTGQPVAGATVNYESYNGDKGKAGVTNTHGLVNLPKTYNAVSEQKPNKPFDNLKLTAAKADDKYGLTLYHNQIGNYDISRYMGTIYTDLGVYRPGETIKWAAIAYHCTNDGNKPLTDIEFKVIFMDRNREPIDTVKARTDAFGRIEGSFLVPKDRMNGSFIITMNWDNARYSSSIASKWVDVSEYKTPTFEVTFPDARLSYTAGQPVKVSGKVETYSGMPVANTQVKLSLLQSQWSWWWWRENNSNGEHLMDTTVTTDAQGLFSFSYRPSLFSENRDYRPGSSCWSRNHYQVVATVTNDAGETHEEQTSFIVGTRRGIELGIENNNVFLNDKLIKLPLVYHTTDEAHPSVMCSWQVTPTDSDTPVKTGTLNTADPTIDLTDVPSGQYRLKVHIQDAEKGEQDVDATASITLYRNKDNVPPVKDCPLWISPLEQTVDSRNVAHIKVGVSVPRAYIYYIASTAQDVVGEGWLDYRKGMHDLAIPMPKLPGADMKVQFITYYDSREHADQVNIANPYKAEALNITATSFRNKLTPGDNEHWTFAITNQLGKPVRAAMLLDMYDKAIASISPNNWTFNNWRRSGTAAALNATGLAGNNATHAHWMGRLTDNADDATPIIPYLYTYDQQLFGRNGGDMVMRMTGSRMMSRNDVYQEAPLERKAYAKDAIIASEEAAFGSTADMAEAVLTAEAPEAEVDERSLEKVQLRENDVKTALWMPMLTSDNTGKIQVEFEVPNFNTTWNTQAVAWNQNLVGSQWLAEVLTQKPLMVKSSMPRFLRQGDKAQLAATVQNATDQASTCDAVIELFDPRSGNTYATRQFNLELDPMGSQAVTIDWQVPDTISMVGFRIKASNGHYGDGEQVMVPVLTTISPVIETQPFYVEAAQSHFKTTLPQFPADARVTLEYCDNPIWYCVLALPTIFNDSYHTATQAAHSLFALRVAQGAAKLQPQIKEAVTYWKQHSEDSTLVSMLQKNQDLKIGTLLASPWMRDADRQTLRMSKLNELFDVTIASQEYEKIITALQSLQMSDGGFTWFRHPNCTSNIWTTGTVLELLGEIKRLGYLPDDDRVNSMIKRAVTYYDNENVSLLNAYKHQKLTKDVYSHFIDYAYTRTLFAEQLHSKASADLFKNTLKYMDKNWSKGITLKNKAYYALTLNRNGYQKTSRSIVESIRQFAISKPSLGMYWDNLQTSNGWWELDKVAYTCIILQALNEVDPVTSELDQVRKWMLLMKQSNDWGSSSLAADAVYSILSTGSQWLERCTTPTIKVAGKPIEMDKIAQWLGYMRTTVPATATGDVVIDRTGNGPAWGSIYCQYKAPMTQIQEKAIEEVSISKEYYVYAQDGTLHQATSFKVGDKVMVRVVIKVNKDMDFVTITDERASCFEPVDQLSGYKMQDRSWFYQETKDSQTNLFFNSLSKGTHIVGYDVWVTNPGEFTSGIATIQCQYAPQLSAHSAGKQITAVNQ